MSTPGFGFGRSPFEEFDELMSRFFGTGGPAASARRPQRVDIGSLLSERARDLVAEARDIAAIEGSEELDARHLLAAATHNDSTRRLLTEAGADPDRIREQLGTGANGGEKTEPNTLTPSAKRALFDAYQISRAEGDSYIGPGHILRALAANPESAAGQALGDGGWEPARLPTEGAGERKKPSTTPTVDEYGRDLTEDARQGRLDPVIGREEEVEQTIEVLSRRSKNNPVLIGDPGVGKTAVVEGIAQRIVAGDVPKTLADKRLVSLDLAGMVAGTKYRGEFEERLKKLLDEVGEHGDELILFLDELHTVVGAGGGGEGALDAGNMLKPALARGELHLIGATTVDEYRRHIEKDAALERRFAPILVGEPSVDDTIEILRGLRDRYEAHHQVRITDEAVVAAAELSDRYITSRFLPDKAIDLMDQAAARVRLRAKTPLADTREIEDRIAALNREKDQAVADEEYERAKDLRDRIKEAEAELAAAGKAEEHVPKVTAEDIAQVVSRTTGIPVAQLTEEERERLMKLEEHLHERVVGQDEAITAVARAVRRARAGMSDPNRPIGSFLFLGPTGVGKTELARALAAALFGDESRMIRLDMSEFQERHTVSRLVGAPPGYVGHEEAGQLTEAVRRQPYTVLLLDEVEKAHPDVFNTLLQLLDDGRLTDSQGRTVDFKNTVVIMTSNIGADRILAAGTEDYTKVRDAVMPALQQHFRPEFLNRIDEIIVFRGLERTQLRQIVDLLLEHTRRRLHAQEVTMEVTDAAADLLANLGYQPDFGARPLRRTIQREVDDRLADMLLSGELNAGDRAVVDAADGSVAIRADKPAGVEG
ncbi:ATP-dependent Clp protease ATP-binding subunit [Streptomyces sp. Ag109_G2-15]|uniref:ATP-dependent Clp protease ATP-binding subunit n=1 Tax=Streptomyces sp. Ag109_G2-15 TaxID=1938850 RepID=UPI000BC5FC0E|nr:ATP-dependent Clp protease ATP-binding subunit [Streptomyces sp. Ag109_G2-15]SOE07441.1 ATP-dependent Clp protease ATP-binding subunit ClpC [Streptomyces sp. Ag109_G2-15]